MMMIMIVNRIWVWAAVRHISISPAHISTSISLAGSFFLLIIGFSNVIENKQVTGQWICIFLTFRPNKETRYSLSSQGITPRRDFDWSVPVTMVKGLEFYHQPSLGHLFTPVIRDKDRPDPDSVWVIIFSGKINKIVVTLYPAVMSFCVTMWLIVLINLLLN